MALVVEQQPVVAMLQREGQVSQAQDSPLA